MLRNWLSMKIYRDKMHRAEFFPALLGEILQKNVLRQSMVA